MKKYIDLLHVNNWIKNGFVIAPAIFSFNLFSWNLLLKTMYAFFSFSFSSSFIYILNNLIDRDKDVRHPVKKNRPIASGLVSVRHAVLMACLLIIPSVAFGILCNRSVLIVISSYIIINILYSIKLKEIPILDVSIVSTGFLLRILAGSFAIGVVSSDWILLTTFFLALFMSFSKRRSEYLLLNKDREKHRLVLGFYSLKLLDIYVFICASLAIISYALYAIDPETTLRFGEGRMVYTVPLVVLGIFRYIMITFQDKKQGDPVEIVLKDKIILAITFTWICIIVVFILINLINNGKLYSIYLNKRL